MMPSIADSTRGDLQHAMSRLLNMNTAARPASIFPRAPTNVLFSPSQQPLFNKHDSLPSPLLRAGNAKAGAAASTKTENE